MVQLIARHTIGRSEIVKKAERIGEKDIINRFDVQPGRPFDEPDEKEAERLIRAGAARRPTEQEAKRRTPAAADVDYDKMTVAELRELAQERELVLGREANTKAEIIAALKKHG